LQGDYDVTSDFAAECAVAPRVGCIRGPVRSSDRGWGSQNVRMGPRSLGEASSVVIRSPWFLIMSLLGAVFAVVGLVTLPIFFSTERNDPVAWSIGLIVLLSGVWVMARTPFMRVAADGTGVRVCGLLRCRHYPWDQVADVRLELVDEVMLGLLRVYAPALVQTDGSERPLRLLAGYSTDQRASRTRMARQTALLRHQRPY
jgi:hypothetical protein